MGYRFFAPLGIQGLQISVSDTIHEIQKLFNTDLLTWSKTGSIVGRYFPSSRQLWDLLPAVRAWHLLGDGNRLKFTKFCIQCINELNPISIPRLTKTGFGLLSRRKIGRKSVNFILTSLKTSKNHLIVHSGLMKASGYTLMVTCQS